MSKLKIGLKIFGSALTLIAGPGLTYVGFDNGDVVFGCAAIGLTIFALVVIWYPLPEG